MCIFSCARRYYVGLDGIQFYSLAPNAEAKIRSILSDDAGRSEGADLRRTMQRLETAYRSCLVPVWPEVVDANPRDINILDRRENIDPIDQVSWCFVCVCVSILCHW